jgi:hypothetical protein
MIHPTASCLPTSLERERAKPAAGEVRSHSHDTCSSLLMCLTEVKCSGDTPRCQNCQRSDLVCVYDPARRDRLGEYVTYDFSY